MWRRYSPRLEFEGYLVCIMQPRAFMLHGVVTKNTIFKTDYLVTDNDKEKAIFALSSINTWVSFTNYNRIIDYKSNRNRSATVSASINEIFCNNILNTKSGLKITFTKMTVLFYIHRDIYNINEESLVCEI